MRTVIKTAGLAAVIALAATTATAPTLKPVISQTAQAVLDGVILGSSAWPSVPVPPDFSSNQSGWVAAGEITGVAGDLFAG